MATADRRTTETQVGYQRSIITKRESRAKNDLNKARAATARITITGSAEHVQALNEAFVSYNTYLDMLPDDVDVHIERAKVHELRHNYDLAIVDLERAAALRPTQAPALNDRVAQLRLL